MLKKKTFTLIELLVVVAIIGVLASMLLPALSNAREKSKQSVCISNLKQVGYAINLATTDDGLLPGPAWQAGCSQYEKNWFIQRYLAEASGFPTAESAPNYNYYTVFECPSFTVGNDPSKTAVDTFQFRTQGKNWGVTKTVSWLFGNGNDHLNTPPKNISIIEDPSSEIAIQEIDLILEPSWYTSNMSPTPRHGFKGGQAQRTKVFFDSHVELNSKY